MHLATGMLTLSDAPKAEAVIKAGRRGKRRDAKRKVVVVLRQECKRSQKHRCADPSAMALWGRHHVAEARRVWQGAILDTKGANKLITVLGNKSEKVVAAKCGQVTLSMV